MDLKAVIESGTEALSDQVEKVAASISPNLASLVESPLGQHISSIVSNAGAKAEEALHSHEEGLPHKVPSAVETPEPVAKAAEQASAAADAAPAASGDVAAAADAAGESGSGSHKALIIGGSLAVAGAAAAAAVVVYRRRRSARDEEWTEDTEGAVVTPLTSASESGDAGSSQAVDSADKENEMTDQTVAAGASYAHELDEEAEHFAKELIDHIDDEDSEEILDPEFTVEVDAEADHFAQELIDNIEVTDEDLAAEEELEKQS